MSADEQIADAHGKAVAELPVYFHAALLGIRNTGIVVHPPRADATGPCQEASSSQSYVSTGQSKGIITAGIDDAGGNGGRTVWCRKELIALVGLSKIRLNHGQLLG